MINKDVIIVLHEIYGANEFIKDKCRTFTNAGFDVVCPNLIGRNPFSYEQADKAYENFTKQIGFQVYEEISTLIDELKGNYERVFVIGFSVGATSCAEKAIFDFLTK